MPPHTPSASPRAVIVGAGIAGLACALRLASGGWQVRVLDRHSHLGGKIRTVPTPAGPVDAGPTVLTMRPVFEDLFAAAGTRLEDHVTLHAQPILARHFWPDGSMLDLHADPEASAEAIAKFAGNRAARQFRRFHTRTALLFKAFEGPVMQSPAPRLGELLPLMLRQPRLLPAMAPFATLRQMLRQGFSDPRLAQLFGRYATYVGGAPGRSPALLSLIWQAEAAGVWVVEGGMHRLAEAIAELARTRGVDLRTNSHVARIELQNRRAVAVHLKDGTRFAADAIIYAGDPRALATGALGDTLRVVAPQTAKLPRSLSARVYSFAATPTGPDLLHHNVFFAADPHSEFDDLAKGNIPRNPTLYICAMDRGHDRVTAGLERFEIIANAPATNTTKPPTDLIQWHHMIMATLRNFGLGFSPTPDETCVTTPQQFAQMFPASQGALYGQSPHGLTAAFRRPTVHSGISGLWLAGGGVHPGAGVPMATFSGKHAAEAIMRSRTSTSLSDRTAMRGGMSTA